MPLSHLSDHGPAASRSRVELCREGLEGKAADRPIWIRTTNNRIEEIERHGAIFGLEDYDAQELADLRECLARLHAASENSR